jgi:hypothetical protein
MKKENLEQYFEKFQKPMAIFGLVLVGGADPFRSIYVL